MASTGDAGVCLNSVNRPIRRLAGAANHLTALVGDSSGPPLPIGAKCPISYRDVPYHPRNARVPNAPFRSWPCPMAPEPAFPETRSPHRPANSRTFTGTLVGNPRDLDVDRFVSLKNTHRAGRRWPPEKREEYDDYLEDLDHLIAVTAGANQSRGARWLDEWAPPDLWYWCKYATDWAEIKYRWLLTMTQRELEFLVDMLYTCENPPGVEVLDYLGTVAVGSYASCPGTPGRIGSAGPSIFNLDPYRDCQPYCAKSTQTCSEHPQVSTQPARKPSGTPVASRRGSTWRRQQPKRSIGSSSTKKECARCWALHAGRVVFDR